jgi:O-antigen ligase
LLALSWYLRFFPWRGTPGDQWSAVPVRDRIIQSGEFLLCAFALTHLSISAWRAEKRGRSAAFMLLALAFLGSIVFVATSRSTLVMFLALLPLLAFQRFDWKGVVVVLMTGAVLASAAWVSSPALRGRVLAVAEEIRKYVTEGEETSAGYRLEFWKKSIEFIATAPVFGHGSGTVEDLFRKSAASEGGRTSSVTDQPHNQTFIVAIQLGLIGTVLLFAFWMAHMMLFRGGGLAAWLGAGIVLQNVIAGLFNSYLFEFTFGWIYIFGVGVLGGMMLRKSGPKTPGLR